MGYHCTQKTALFPVLLLYSKPLSVVSTPVANTIYDIDISSSPPPPPISPTTDSDYNLNVILFKIRGRRQLTFSS